MKSKTVAAWLAFLGGPIGLHRFYLHGARDWLAWLLPVPTLLGAYGVLRMWNLGQDDVASWILIQLLEITVAGGCLMAIVYGLMKPEEWYARFYPLAEPDAPPGRTRWASFWAIVFSLSFGTILLFSTIAMSF